MASGIAGDGAVVVQLIDADAVGRVLDITPIGVYAREDIPGRAAAKVKNRHYGVLAVRAALEVAEVRAAAPERVALMAFEGELDLALVEDVLQREGDIVGKCCPVTDVVQGLLRLGGTAFSALGIGLGVVEQNLRVADIVPRVG